MSTGDTATEQCPDMIWPKDSKVSVVGEKSSLSRQTRRLQAGCFRAVVQQYKTTGNGHPLDDIKNLL